MLKPKAIHFRRISQLTFLLIFLILFLQVRDPLSKAIPPDLLLRIDPLAALITMIASRTFVASFGLSAIVLVLAFVLGRSFCGWICPLGASLDLWNRMVKPGHSRGNQRWKYTLLTGMLLLALLSLQTDWLLDPLVIFTRSLTLVLYPLSVWSVDGLINAGFESSLTEGIAFWFWDVLQGWFLPLTTFQTATLTVSLSIFMGILFLDTAYGRRFWCRVLCPLGALLGLIARYSPFGRRVSDECTECALCATDCRMNAIEEEYSRTRRHECILCLECKYVCAIEGTTYNWHYQKDGQEHLDLGRRRTIGVLGGSIAFGGLMRASLISRKDEGYLIRPPGSVEEERFLDLCLRCEECVKACSSTGGCLQPAGPEYGWSSFWSPRARMREGYCEYTCTLCGQVCPSGAIKMLTEEAKKQTVIGRAYFDKNRCIPWATGVDCIVCEEHCPTPEKAIQFRLGDLETLDGIKHDVKLPYVDPSLCIGCGICEAKCPVLGESAIRITNEGQQRVS